MEATKVMITIKLGRRLDSTADQLYPFRSYPIILLFTSVHISVFGENSEIDIIVLRDVAL